MACATVASESCYFETRVTSNNAEIVEAYCAQLNVSTATAAYQSDYACNNDAAHIKEDIDVYDEIGGDGPYLVATGVSVH